MICSSGLRSPSTGEVQDGERGTIKPHNQAVSNKLVGFRLLTAAKCLRSTHGSHAETAVVCEMAALQVEGVLPDLYCCIWAASTLRDMSREIAQPTLITQLRLGVVQRRQAAHHLSNQHPQLIVQELDS